MRCRAGATPSTSIFIPVSWFRGRDQEEVQPGALLCRIGQSGVDGSWTGEDSEGNPLRVTTGKNGLEIYALSEEEIAALARAELGSAPSGALDRLRRRFGPKQRVGDAREQEAEMRNMQAYLDELHRPRS